MTDSIFEFEDASMQFGRKVVLRDLSLSIEAGAVTVLLGRNGAGKSTLLRLALGLLRPTSGRVRVFGRDPVRDARTVRERIGYVPSVPDVPPWMTPADLCRFASAQYPTWDRALAAELTTSLAVPERTPFRHLSRGEGMKALVVAALAPAPPLLVLDEPFAGLDAIAREELLRGVVTELRMSARTIVCATHDLDIAVRVADRVALLENGNITAHGPLEEVLDARNSEAGSLQGLEALLVGRAAPEDPS
jgi:ABC-2 type transport system ATP-binding protein